MQNRLFGPVRSVKLNLHVANDDCDFESYKGGDRRLRITMNLRETPIFTPPRFLLMGRASLIAGAAILFAAINFCPDLFGASKILTFSDCPYAETPLPRDYGSDKEVSLTWGTEGRTSPLITSTGESPFSDHSLDATNRFIFAQGTSVIQFNPTVRVTRVFVRDNEPDFLEYSASGLTISGELQSSPVFSETADFVPTVDSGIWIEVEGQGAIDTLRFISHDDLTKSYLVDDLEFEIYSETEVIALAGLNQSVLEGSTVTLDGRGSVNADSFSWAQLRLSDEPQVTLASPAEAVTTFMAPPVPTAAVLTFELTASGPLGSDTDRIEVKVNISKPPATPPEGLTVLPGEAERALRAVVEWAAHPDAASYAVYRAEGAPQSDYVKVAPSIPLAGYEDDWLEEGSIYFYKVAAANGFGLGPPSEPVGFVACRNLALDADALPMARIISPTGTGSKDIEVIRDGVTQESYDSYHGGVTESEDSYGYLWEQPRYFDTIVYYEGKNFRDGGWWSSLTVQYTPDGENWMEVEGLTISPDYNFQYGLDGRCDYMRFLLTFERCQGISVRIFGEPGGNADFTSIAELEVYGDQAANIVVADAGPDLRQEESTPVTLHGENSLNAEEHSWEQITLGDEPQVSLAGADTPNPTFLVEDVPANTVFTFRLMVMGFHGPKSDTVRVTVVNREPPGVTEGLSAAGGDPAFGGVELSWRPNNDATSYNVLRSTAPAAGESVIASGITTASYVDADPDLKPYHAYYYRVVGVNDYGDGPTSTAASGTPIENLAMYPDALPIAAIPHPTGSGQKDLDVIRNGIVHEKGYDSFDGANPAEEDWYGYLWSDPVYPDTVVYTMGKNYLDGGWWTFLTVQYTTDGETWLQTPNVTITPPYDSEDYYAARPNYSRYTLTFDRVRALGLRIYGKPGGIAEFASIVELEVYGLDAPLACTRELVPLFYTPGGTVSIVLSVEIHEPPPPDSLTVTELVPEQASLVNAAGGDIAVPGQITWSFGPGEIAEMQLAYTIAIPRDHSGTLSFQGSLSYGDVSDQRIRGEDSLYAKLPPTRNLRLEMTLLGHLRWSPVLDEGVVGYHVYRSINGEAYEDISGLLAEAFFDDGDVEEGPAYRYKVTVENASGVESELAESGAAGPASVIMRRIEFEDYDYGRGLFPGGEGRTGFPAPSSDDISGGNDYFFHNTDATNAYRPGDAVDITAFDDAGHFICGAAEGDWWRFSFDLPQAGYIKIADLRAASSDEATYDFFWDDLPAGKFSFNTGGEDTWRTYQMDIPPFMSSEGVHTLRIRAAAGVSSADSFGIAFGWSPPKRQVIFADDFDRYATSDEVVTLGKWGIVNGSAEPQGAWRLWNTGGEPLAEDEPGPDFPGFASGYMISNGDFAGGVQLDEELLSPQIDCTRYICVAVQFLGAINIYETDPDGDLQTTDFDISLYDEKTKSWSEWVNLFTRDRTGGDDFSAIPKWFDISSLADGKTVKFRWHFYNTTWDYWWAVDDVRVSGEKRPPRVISAAVGPLGSVTLSWESFGQGLYTVEFSDDILEGTWQPVPGADWPTVETTWQGDDLSEQRRRFYRVTSE